MTNVSKIREAHRIIKNAGSVMTREQIYLLRSVLPPLPKQKTLEEITEHVYDAWVGTEINEWPDDIHGDLEIWLHELHEQLKGLEHYAEPFNPVHPEFLETEADYENAPEGTVVAVNGSKIPTVKDDGWPVHMAVMPRRVLRWGND